MRNNSVDVQQVMYLGPENLEFLLRKIVARKLLNYTLSSQSLYLDLNFDTLHFCTLPTPKTKRKKKKKNEK